MAKIHRTLFIIAILIMLMFGCTVKASQTPEPVRPTDTPAGTSTTKPTATEVPPTATSEPTATEGPPTATSEPTATVTPSVDVENWWNDTVFYEVFVRSFYDSDGDGVGDLNGLIEKLDYLNDGDPATTDDLGITGIWLMPITESPSYHGYDVVDYFSVDQEYGNNEDFIRLVEEAHQRGIYVIVDLVMNHTSSQHPWFVESKAEDPYYRDWYIWASEDPAYLGPWNQKVWNLTDSGYYYSVFWSGMPDLNLRNPEVTAELYEVIRFWLEDLNADGFRLDAIIHLIEDGRIQINTPETHQWLQEFNQFYKGVDPSAFTVGEAWTSADEVLDYTGDEVDIAFAFDLADAFIHTVKSRVTYPVVNELSKNVESYPAGQYATFLTNHDQNRLMSQIRDLPKAKLAALMLLTSPGVPFIYYGEEIGMVGVKPDEDIRRPMQWNADFPGVGFTQGTPWREPAPDYTEVNVTDQTNDPDSLLTHYRGLIQLRNQYPALRTGGWVPVESGSRLIYAYLRYRDNENILVLMNVSPDEINAGEYGLSLEMGALTGPVQAVSLFGLENPMAPELAPAGGFTDYTPFESIPGQGFAVIQFLP